MPTKTIKSDADAEAGLVVAKNATRIHGNKDNYVMADEKGVIVAGPVSFVAGSAQMRFGGLWVMNNEMQLSLPSTLATPHPVMVINPPLKQLAGIMEDAAIMMQLLGTFGTL